MSRMHQGSVLRDTPPRHGKLRPAAVLAGRQRAFIHVHLAVIMTRRRLSESSRLAGSIMLLRCLLLILAAVALPACVTVTTEPRAVLLEEHSQMRVQRLNCTEAVDKARH